LLGFFGVNMLFFKGELIKAGTGSAHHKSKMTELTVSRMRDKYAEGGYTYKKLGKLYGISMDHVGKIIRREKWKHI